MYMWYEEMGLICMPDSKFKENFKLRFELAMRRLASKKIAERLSPPTTSDKEVAV